MGPRFSHPDGLYINLPLSPFNKYDIHVPEMTSTVKIKNLKNWAFALNKK